METLIEESRELRGHLTETILSQACSQIPIRNKPKSAQTATPSKYPQGHFKPKSCRMCSTVFSPKAPSEHYCSEDCKNRAGQSNYLKRTYGITVDDYEVMYEDQQGLCVICRTEGFVMDPKHTMKLVVDHCHATGVVRGLLCHNCNRALGLLHDDTTALQRAIDYLKVQRLFREEVEPSGSKRATP